MPLQNTLLARLPRGERGRLCEAGEQVPISMEEVLYREGRAIEFVYFPTTGVISLVAMLDRKPVVEVGMVGYEGLIGLPLALGATLAPFYAVVQGPGFAWRVPREAFLREFKRSAALRRLTYLYTHVSMIQLASSATCMSMHRLGSRLARWLLMTQNRSRSHSFQVTHEFLAYMLGVRRAGVTLAAKALQREGLIQYRRGNLIVLDRRGLKAAACPCYDADRKAYATLIG